VEIAGGHNMGMVEMADTGVDDTDVVDELALLMAQCEYTVAGDREAGATQASTPVKQLTSVVNTSVSPTEKSFASPVLAPLSAPSDKKAALARSLQQSMQSVHGNIQQLFVTSEEERQILDSENADNQKIAIQTTERLDSEKRS
jgi:hypothetical protein